MLIVGIAVALAVVCGLVLAVRCYVSRRRDRRSATARQVRQAARYHADPDVAGFRLNAERPHGPAHAIPVPMWQPPSWPSRVRRPGNLLFGDPYAGDVHKPHDPWAALYASEIVRGETQ